MIDLKKDKKFVINLERRPDRLLEIEKQFYNLNFENYEIFKAVDGILLSKHIKLKQGQVACRLSHKSLIEKAKAERLKHVIIFEDDADLDSDIINKFQNLTIPEDWDVLYLGAHNFRPLKMINENIGRCVTSLSTVAYIVNYKAYDEVLSSLNNDEILDLIYCNHLSKSLNMYCVKPNLVVQRSGYSDIEQHEVDYSIYYRK